MTTYADLDQRLTGRCTSRRKIANNTYAERRGEAIAVRLHSTDVVTFHSDGSITLDTGGWYTVTTKDRLNSYLPYGIWEADFCDLGDACPGEHEYVGDSMHFHGRHVGPKGRVWSNRSEWQVSWFGQIYPFHDGMTLHPDGTVSGLPPVAVLEMERIQRAEMRKAIAKFVKGITPERIVHAWENVEGDCWGCRMVAAEGERPLGHSCLASHVEDDYFHASLAFRAIQARGYRDPNFIMQMIYADAKAGRVESALTISLKRLLTKSLIEGVATR